MQTFICTMRATSSEGDRKVDPHVVLRPAGDETGDALSSFMRQEITLFREKSSPLVSRENTFEEGLCLVFTPHPSKLETEPTTDVIHIVQSTATEYGYDHVMSVKVTIAEIVSQMTLQILPTQNLLGA
jgi:hypothetical protein